MTPTDLPASRPAAERSALVTAWAGCAALLVLLVLVQAALAGQALFGTTDIAVHGYVANASFALGLLGAVLAGLARVGKGALALAAVVLALLFVQVGLGYVGRSSTAAAAWHVPLGVAVFGLTTVQLAVALPKVRAAR